MLGLLPVLFLLTYLLNMKKRLYLFINNEFYSIFTPTFFGLMLMILTLRLIKIFESLQTTLTPIELIKIISLVLPSVYLIILPISYLIAITITLTKISSTNELIAFYNSGISHFRLLKIFFHITIPIILFHLTNSLIIKPNSNKFLREIINSKFQDITALPQKNTFTKLSKGQYIYLEEKSENISQIIYTNFKNNNFITISAKTGSFDKGKINFKFGNLISTNDNKTEILDFENLVLEINQDTEKKEEEIRRGSIPLWELIKIYQNEPQNNLIKTELFYRIFYPLGPLILLILSFPLSIGFSRHYKTQGILISIFSGLLFYIVFNMIDNLSIKGKINPLIGFLTAYLFLTLISIWIFFKKGLIKSYR